MNQHPGPIRPADRPFHADPGESLTMPARMYHHADVFQAEKAAIFYWSWVYVGHVGQVAEAGHFLTARISDQNVFVVRARDGGLKAFFIVCMHRGHELLEGCGKTNLTRCPTTPGPMTWTAP